LGGAVVRAELVQYLTLLLDLGLVRLALGIHR
jgi:hypothetical protein